MVLYQLSYIRIPDPENLFPASATSGTLDDVFPQVQSLVRPAIVGGRYWVRTSDLFGVNEARYHCANRPNEG